MFNSIHQQLTNTHIFIYTHGHLLFVVCGFFEPTNLIMLANFTSYDFRDMLESVIIEIIASFFHDGKILDYLLYI